MASAIIHMCVAKEINKKLKRETKDYYLGSIAPDTNKILGQTKAKAHFYNEIELVDLDMFKNKYPDFYNNDFDLGYYIHLYTDLLWNEIVFSKIIFKNEFLFLDGNLRKMEKQNFSSILYDDYTSLNSLLLDEYGLDLSLFYDDFFTPNTKIDEIPIKEMPLFLKEMGMYVKNSKLTEFKVLDLEMVKKFIKLSVSEIASKL
ncbi:MAG: hypothetical protein R3Y21_04745 [Mycoplasmatota bacterium]